MVFFLFQKILFSLVVVLVLEVLFVGFFGGVGFCCLFVYQDKVSMCSSPGTYSVCQGGLNLREPTASAS